MLLQDVKELINQLDFEAAIFKLEKIIFEKKEDDLTEAYQLLVYLLQSQNSKKQNKVELDYFHYLAATHQNDLLYKLLKTKNISEELKDFEQIKIYLNLLWELGRFQEFSDEINRVNIYLLENKRTNKYLEFYKLVKDKTQKFEFMEIGMLMMLVDTGDTHLLLSKLEEILIHGVYSNRYDFKKRLKLVMSLKAIVEEYSEDNFKVYYYALFLNILECVFNKSEMNKKKVIELLLLLEKGIHGVFLLELDLDLDQKNKIVGILKNKFKVQKRDIPPHLKIARTFFENQVIVTTKQIHISENENIMDIPKYPLHEKSLELIGLEEKKTPNEIERDLITQFEHDEFELEQLKSLIISLIEMDMCFAARKLVLRLEDSSEKFYLLAEVHLRLSEYSEVIYFSNKAIADYKLMGEKRLPFLYLKQKAYEYSNKRLDEKKILKEIALIDPNFMNAGRKLSL